MLIGSQERTQTMQGSYKTYNILGDNFELLTIGDWIRVCVVDWNNKDHLNDQYVHNIKLGDFYINQLMTKKKEYNIMCTVDSWRTPFNHWMPWPSPMYVHNSIETFSSTVPAYTINNSNLLSTSEDQPPVEVNMDHDHSTIGFGFAAGDTFYGYGDWNKAGFTQHFSGPGRGSVFVR